VPPLPVEISPLAGQRLVLRQGSAGSQCEVLRQRRASNWQPQQRRRVCIDSVPLERVCDLRAVHGAAATEAQPAAIKLKAKRTTYLHCLILASWSCIQTCSVCNECENADLLSCTCSFTDVEQPVAYLPNANFLGS
jgi:hypothetical protein